MTKKDAGALFLWSLIFTTIYCFWGKEALGYATASCLGIHFLSMLMELK